VEFNYSDLSRKYVNVNLGLPGMGGEGDTVMRMAMWMGTVITQMECGRGQ